MATQRTSRAGLEYWQYLDPNWHLPYQRTCGKIDAANAVGTLAVIPVLVDGNMAPLGLNVKVSAGSFVRANGLVYSYAGTSSQAVAASNTNYVYLDDSGTLTVNTTGFPAANCVPLAVVVTGATDITSITDARVAFVSAGVSGLRLSEASNGPMGVATLVAGTVTVSNTRVTASSRIFLTAQSLGGTAGALYVSARTAGTSFAITSTSGSDTSVVAWQIVEPSA